MGYYTDHLKPQAASTRLLCAITNLLSFQIIALNLAFPVLAAPAPKEPTSDKTSTTTPFTEPATSIPMQRFFGARTSFALGIALPTAQNSTSFIGQMSFPLGNGVGWGAMGFTGSMEGNFILAVWPDGKGGVTASFRQATNEDDPPEVTGKFKVRPIAKGVVVNNTALTYTFLCENCLDATLGLGVEQTAADAVMGWALSHKAVQNPTDPGAFLAFHEQGFGPFTARLAQAKAPDDVFNAVAATAGEPAQSSRKARAPTPGAFENGSGDESGGNSGDDSDSDSD
ncbi:hypothetical protein MCOR25_006662 [Pyricularia grisea]|nr:hypothetical protein MCOR25_006662 [Pyricularia grisea]